MEIPLVNTQYLIKEVPTDGHAPMQFRCDDENIYYCKYRLRLKPERELDFLLYEVIAHFLLRWLNIPTPDIAFVQVQEDSFSPRDLKQNRTHCRPGIVCFGSKEVKARIVTPIETIANKKDFNRLANPTDLLKIAMFDQWVGNIDRGKPIGQGYNYNLLLSEQRKKLKYLAFDHAFIFGGESNLRIFNATSLGYNRDGLVGRNYFRSVLRYIRPQTCLKLIDEFFVTLQNDEWQNYISDAMAQCAIHWPIHANTERRMVDLLANQQRLQHLKDSIHQTLSYHLK